jgi:RHS repeat-associated protein
MTKVLTKKIKNHSKYAPPYVYIKNRYDLNGNLTAEQDGPFDDAAVTGSANVYTTDGGVNYTESAWGLGINGAGASAAVNRREYRWNERNQLSWSSDQRYSVKYTYDHSGERTGKYATSAGGGGDSETLYFNRMWNWRYDGLLSDRSGNNSKHVFLGDTRIATKVVSASGSTAAAETVRQYYYHSDHLGSAQLITDYRGEEYERLEYTPYGELWIEKAAAVSVLDIPYRFTGKERDEETGLYYYGARYLDPKTSRWLSGDPALGEYVPSAPINDEAKKRNGSLPGQGGVFNYVNLHVYHYAGNNPVKYVDPDGEAVWVPIIIVGAIAIASIFRSDVASSPSPVNMDDSMAKIFTLSNKYYNGHPRVTISDPNLAKATKTISLYRNPLSILHAMQSGAPQPNDYNNGYDVQSNINRSPRSVAASSLSALGAIAENMTDGKGNKFGDIRLEYNTNGGRLTDWSIIETNYNHVSGKLEDRYLSLEEAQGYLLLNKDQINEKKYREIFNKLGLD